MKIKVYRSKVSKKRFTSPAFPKVTRKDAENAPSVSPETTSIYKLERSPVVISEEAAVGFFCIKNLKEIILLMRDEKERFGECLNRLISVYTDVVESEDGIMSRFSDNGALFSYRIGKKPEDAVQKAFVACLRMRYLLNKLNRQWDLSRNPWKISFGVDVGDVTVREIRESGKTEKTLSGNSAVIARGIGISAAAGQILVSDQLFLRFPALETFYDVKKAYHVPVIGEEHLSKIREVVGMVGPQAKKIYEDFV